MKIIEENIIIDNNNNIRRIDNDTSIINNQDITLSELMQTEVDTFARRYHISVELYDDEIDQNVVLVNDKIVFKALSEKEILKITIKQMIECYNNL